MSDINNHNRLLEVCISELTVRYMYVSIQLVSMKCYIFQKVFEPYWSQEDISHGLKRGTLIQVVITYEPHREENGILPR